MAFESDDEQIPVRSPVRVETAKPASNQDENDWSTLLNIHKDIQEQMGLLGSVDDLDLEEKDGSLKEQIAVNKKVRKILEPIAVEIESAVQGVELKTKERY